MTTRNTRPALGSVNPAAKKSTSSTDPPTPTTHGFIPRRGGSVGAGGLFRRRMLSSTGTVNPSRHPILPSPPHAPHRHRHHRHRRRLHATRPPRKGPRRLLHLLRRRGLFLRQ